LSAITSKPADGSSFNRPISSFQLPVVGTSSVFPPKVSCNSSLVLRNNDRSIRDLSLYNKGKIILIEIFTFLEFKYQNIPTWRHTFQGKSVSVPIVSNECITPLKSILRLSFAFSISRHPCHLKFQDVFHLNVLPQI
jgi:hypothetical protein